MIGDKRDYSVQDKQKIMYSSCAKQISIFTVRTPAGISFNLEAKSATEALVRANSPEIGEEIARMIRSAISNVTSVEIFRGSQQFANKKLLFPDTFFKNLD